jgi:hypothetical protein
MGGWGNKLMRDADLGLRKEMEQQRREMIHNEKGWTL